ncbi:molybdenum cofactor guanylyltransferase [Alicyclobacillus fastidiosus]|uniref:NTP transferase domain-containing protein n=1 Tax=Alicyclobacillus fastidiosus TaxID=392011 RepID=A0ABV5AF87_9BACL|nr:NTP transferase domain-containing protein [Alicyclobacillus fastidiosus]WEH12160.1 NTP transferase domain-containing protein [Alicyclobacillus fastidiosus]
MSVVVAGGRSRRMEPLGNKLLLPRSPSSPPILTHVVTTAAKVSDSVVIAYADEHVKEAIASELAPEDAWKVHWQRDEAPESGPLVALAAIFPLLQALGADRVVVVAGDLPGVTADVLVRCRDALADSEADCAAIERSGRLQPLLACYRTTAGQAFVEAVEDGQTRLMSAVEKLCVVRVRMGERTPEWRVRPVHTPQDYDAWLAWRDSFETS